MHPTMIPFLIPMKSSAKGLAAYIVPVNHNRINTGLVTSIASNMMNCYSQDNTKDVFQLQDMGTDAVESWKDPRSGSPRSSLS
jgi:hypothetical protein